MRRAHTMPELAVTLALLALVAAIALPSVSAVSARWQVRAAVADIVNALVLAREAALTRGNAAAFVVDAPRGVVYVTSGPDTLISRAVGAQHGVSLSASGDSVRYTPDGVATGVSNTTVLVARGARIDSVVVSRLGRVRWTE